MPDPHPFVATNRQKVLEQVQAGDPLHPTEDVWTFANEPEADGSNHLLAVTGTEDVAGFTFPTWNEFSAPRDFLRALFGAAPGTAPVLTLHVHGFNNDFKESVAGASDLQSGLAAAGYGGTLAAYDWPSRGGVQLYPQDRAAAEASGEALLSWLRTLFRSCARRGLVLNVVCHSMGNYALSQAALARANRTRGTLTPWVDRLIMLGADVASTVFDVDSDGDVRDPAGAAVASMCSDIRILYCPDDPVLAACEAIERPDEPRLGRTGPAGAALPPNVSALDMRPYGVRGHGDYFLPTAENYWAGLLLPS